MIKNPELILFLSDARGIYIPRDFATGIKRELVTGVSAESWEILEAGPEHEWYWEAWQEVCDRAVVTEPNGSVYSVYQDGDCWLVPKGMVWDDARDFWAWPEELEEEDA